MCIDQSDCFAIHISNFQSFQVIFIILVFRWKCLDKTAELCVFKLLFHARVEPSDVDVIVAVAGREGALPTLVAGMVDVPLIGVPTSYGYGFGGKGISALMAMLQSCSLGLAVVNIDGGIPAGSVAALIANRAARFRKKVGHRRVPRRGNGG